MSFQDYYAVWKIYLCEFLVKWLHWYHVKRGQNPYTKLDFRLRWGAHILPTPVTNFHCLCCNKFTLRNRHRVDWGKLKDYSWAGFKYVHSDYLYLCSGCKKQGEENKQAYNFEAYSYGL